MKLHRMQLYFVRRTLEPYGTGPLDRARNKAFDLPFDEYPETWTTAIIWRSGSLEATARVIQGHLNLEDEALEGALARAIAKVKTDPGSRSTLLGEVDVRPELRA